MDQDPNSPERQTLGYYVGDILELLVSALDILGMVLGALLP